MKSLIFLVIALFGASQAQEIFNRVCRTPEQYGGVVTDFQPALYLGEWFEIERYEQFFQRGKDCTVATYSLNADGSIRVFNKAFDLAANETDPAADWSIDIGRATISFPDQVPLRGKLNVTFDANGATDSSNYWILETNYIDYAIVVSCTNLPLGRSAESYWYLSRTKEPTVEGRIVANAVIDTQLEASLIRPTIQKGCGPPPPDPSVNYRINARI